MLCLLYSCYLCRRSSEREYTREGFSVSGTRTEEIRTEFYSPDVGRSFHRLTLLQGRVRTLGLADPIDGCIHDLRRFNDLTLLRSTPPLSPFPYFQPRNLPRLLFLDTGSRSTWTQSESCSTFHFYSTAPRVPSPLCAPAQLIHLRWILTIGQWSWGDLDGTKGEREKLTGNFFTKLYVYGKYVVLKFWFFWSNTEVPSCDYNVCGFRGYIVRFHPYRGKGLENPY